IITHATAQNSNLSSAYSYVNAYKGMRETFESLGLDYNNDTTGNVSKLHTLFDMTQTEVNNSLMDDDGNVYSKMDEKDKDGNPLYKYTDSDGNETIITAITSYSAEAADGVDASKYSRTDGKNYYDGHELTATSTKDDEGRVKYTYKDDNGQTQEVYLKINKDVNYFKGATAYEETVTGDDGEETTKTSYTVATTPASNVKSAYEMMDSIKESLSETMKTSIMSEDPSLSEEEALEQAKTKVNDLVGTLQTYVNQVDAFEEKSQDASLGTKDSPGEYSTWDIASKVKTAYDSGVEGALDDLTAEFTSKIQENKELITTNSVITEKYSNLKSLSEVEEGSEEYENILSDLVTKALNAKDIIASGTGYNSGAAKIDGSDAVIKLGGIEYTSSSNSFSINGLSIQALQETGDGDENAITINTQTDTQGLYDKVKDFISTYNDIINELTELYNASSSKGYEPLTDDEKAEMSDKQIEQWETKIKDSLLRRDQTLGGIINSMTTTMSSVYSIDGKNYSLASFGIKTQGILNSAQNKQNAYHIDGDEDDSVTSAKTDKLMAALTGDPDTVTSFLQKLTNGLHDSLDKKMRATSMKSAYTVYNDKEMSKEYSDYTKLIKQWETRVSDAENRYYKQFSNMESALTKLQGSSSSITGMFG
nr:flagellar filament capping protein FliD [Lachnospiraceae bacterium]